jgi:cell division protein FtsB
MAVNLKLGTNAFAKERKIAELQSENEKLKERNHEIDSRNTRLEARLKECEK